MLKLSHHRHTGRHLPRHHTSWSALIFITLIAGVALLSVTTASLADSGQVSLTGVVLAPPPPTAPQITAPTNSQSFTSTPVDVAGTCRAGLVVKIFRNNTQAGAATCNGSGQFSLKIDLFAGSNTLVARQYNVFDHASPDSNAVIVTYGAGSASEQPPPTDQLIVTTANTYLFGVNAGQELKLPASLAGGTGPYAVNVDWGDGSAELISLSAKGPFGAKHKYSKPGNYKVVITATDSAGRKAYLQLVVVVNGEAAPASVTNRSFYDGGLLFILWPLYLLMLAMLISFWLGEKYEKHVIAEEYAGMAV